MKYTYRIHIIVRAIPIIIFLFAFVTTFEIIDLSGFNYYPPNRVNTLLGLFASIVVSLILPYKNNILVATDDYIFIPSPWIPMRNVKIQKKSIDRVTVKHKRLRTTKNYYIEIKTHCGVSKVWIALLPDLRENIIEDFENWFGIEIPYE